MHVESLGEGDICFFFVWITILGILGLILSVRNLNTQASLCFATLKVYLMNFSLLLLLSINGIVERKNRTSQEMARVSIHA